MFPLSDNQVLFYLPLGKTSCPQYQNFAGFVDWYYYKSLVEIFDIIKNTSTCDDGNGDIAQFYKIEGKCLTHAFNCVASTEQIRRMK